jgi:hypothetical protein
MSGAHQITEQEQQTIAQAFGSLPLPQVVFNGFAHNLTASEIASVVSFGPRPLLMLVMPPVVAKSFALSLLEMVERYEAATGTAVGTIAELAARLAAYQAEQKA